MGRVSLLLFSLLLINTFGSAQEKPEDQFRIEPGRTAEDYYNIGNWYSKREQHYRAIAYYKAAIDKKEEYVQAWINLGASYRAVERFEDAITAYQKAIDIGSEEHFVYLNLGNALVAANRLREATIPFRTYITLEPYDPDGYVNLGITLFRLQDYSQAAETFEILLIIEKDNAYFRFQTARCYALLKETEKTVLHLREALSLDPKIRFALLQDSDFRNFRRSQSYRSLMAEFEPDQP